MHIIFTVLLMVQHSNNRIEISRNVGVSNYSDSSKIAFVDRLIKEFSPYTLVKVLFCNKGQVVKHTMVPLQNLYIYTSQHCKDQDVKKALSQALYNDGMYDISAIDSIEPTILNLDTLSSLRKRSLQSIFDQYFDKSGVVKNIYARESEIAFVFYEFNVRFYIASTGHLERRDLEKIQTTKIWLSNSPIESFKSAVNLEFNK